MMLKESRGCEEAISLSRESWDVGLRLQEGETWGWKEAFWFGWTCARVELGPGVFILELLPARPH